MFMNLVRDLAVLACKDCSLVKILLTMGIVYTLYGSVVYGYNLKSIAVYILLCW